MEWVMIHKIKALYDEGQGLEIRAIARQLGISRNTVKKYLRMDEVIIHHQQTNQDRSKRLDDQREYIIHLLNEFPRISAVKVLLKLQKKHPELVVSYRTARRYISQLKKSITIKQNRYYEPILDMVPGVQCQVDGGELKGVLIGNVECVIYFVVFVLSYSRMMYVAFSRKPVNTDIFIKMHDTAFCYFGGHPEECVYDQTKLVVLHEEYREIKLNQKFHAYATSAGFRIRACEGYDPESKGKVEAGVKFVQNNGLYGEVFDDWNHLESYMQQWLDETANVRIHGTTGESPLLRYERDEFSHMGTYLTPLYLAGGVSHDQTRGVDKTGLLSWNSNKYSAPMAYQKGRVGVRVEGAQLIISDLETGQEITRHNLSYEKGKVIKNNDHYRNKQDQIADLEIGIIQQLKIDGGEILCALLKRTNPQIYKDQLIGLKTLLNRYEMSPQLLARLCDRSQLSTSQIRDYLEAYAAHPELLDSDPPVPNQMDKYIPESSELIRYSGIALMGQEVGHDLLH